MRKKFHYTPRGVFKMHRYRKAFEQDPGDSLISASRILGFPKKSKKSKTKMALFFFLGIRFRKFLFLTISTLSDTFIFSLFMIIGGGGGTLWHPHIWCFFGNLDLVICTTPPLEPTRRNFVAISRDRIAFSDQIWFVSHVPLVGSSPLVICRR